MKITQRGFENLCCLGWLFVVLSLFGVDKVCAQNPTSSATAPELVLAGDKHSLPVVVAPKAPVAERQAAMMLTNYLSRISGIPFKLVESAGPLDGGSILVGSVAGPLAQGLRGDSFVIKSDGQHLRIVGATPMGTAFGAATFLEEQWGCRFWSWNEEEVPQQATLRMPSLEKVMKAPFSQAEVWNREAQTPQNGFVYRAKSKSTESFTGTHTLYPLLKSYGGSHPEIFPMDEKTGKRAGNDLHLCYMAPGIAEALAAALEKVVQSKQGNVKDFIYFAGMGDWEGGMCMCDVCKKVYEEEKWARPDGKVKQGYTGTLLRMINQTAEILEKKYPGIRVGTFAYMSLEPPPGITKPRDNVVIQVPRLRHCKSHPVDVCEGNASYLQNLKRWLEIAPGRVYVWDYNINFGGNFMYPFPTLKPMAETLRAYARLGVAGVAIQGNYVSMGGDLAVLKNYVLRKVFWNPELKTDDLIAEFCKGYYGPVADEMIAYINLQEGYAGDSRKKHLDEFVNLTRADGRPRFLSKESVLEYRARMDAMLAKCAGQEPWTRRVKEAQASLLALELWPAPGLLTEAGGRLVRNDLPNPLAYDEFMAFLPFTRDCSPSEFGEPRAYQHKFLANLGGPLPVISMGDVTVKIAPALASCIYQILYQAKPLLYVPTDPKQKPYPIIGGIHSAVHSTLTTGGVRTSTLVGDPTATKVEMEGEAGVELWGGFAKQIHKKTVELLEGGVLRLTGTARSVPKVVAKFSTCDERTEYLDGLGKPGVVEAQLPSGEWKALEYTTVTEKPKTRLLVPPASALPQGAAVPPQGVDVPPPAVVDPPAAAEPSVQASPGKAGRVYSQAVIPPGTRALRVHLKTSNCRVEDQYLSPAVTGGFAFFDPLSGVLETRVYLEKVDVPLVGEGTWMVREMRFANDVPGK